MNTAETAVAAVEKTTLATVIAFHVGKNYPEHGGTFAGIVYGEDGAPKHHLIVGPELGGELNWEDAKTAAGKSIVDGHQDFKLPLRREQAVMFGNVRSLFLDEWYWSGEEYAGNSDYAWCTGFSHGNQDSYHRSSKLRARAVRRLPI